MQKTNFATRVQVRLAPKADASGSSNQLRQDLSNAINKNKVSIDTSVFRKTDEDRVALKIAKMQWKAAQK